MNNRLAHTLTKVQRTFLWWDAKRSTKVLDRARRAVATTSRQTFCVTRSCLMLQVCTRVIINKHKKVSNKSGLMYLLTIYLYTETELQYILNKIYNKPSYIISLVMQTAFSVQRRVLSNGEILDKKVSILLEPRLSTLWFLKCSRL